MTKTQKNTGREPSLKGRNAAYLWSFIGVNLAIFLSLLVTKELTAVDHFWKQVTAKDGIIAAVILGGQAVVGADVREPFSPIIGHFQQVAANPLLTNRAIEFEVNSVWLPERYTSTNRNWDTRPESL